MPQRPTLSDVKITSSQDAQVILYACYKGVLPMIQTRLDQRDRHALTTGNVYAWEERNARSEPGVGIERFTEGRRWSPSRLRDDFLYYYEKYLHLTEQDQRVVQPPQDWQPLVKQTYSAWVVTNHGERKWHLTAYYTEASRDALRTVELIPELHGLNVPEGHFRSNADVKTRRSEEMAPESSSSSITRTFAPFSTVWGSTEPSSMAPSFSHFSVSGTGFAIPNPISPDTQPAPPPQRIPYSSRQRSLPYHSPSTPEHHRSRSVPSAQNPLTDSPQQSEIPSYSAYAANLHNPPNLHFNRETPSPAQISYDTSPSLLVASEHSHHSPSHATQEPRSLGLVPLSVVLRHHPYKRDPIDDQALRSFGPPTSAEAHHQRICEYQARNGSGLSKSLDLPRYD